MFSPSSEHPTAFSQELAALRAGSTEAVGQSASEREAVREEAADLEHALAQLPEHYQQVLRLRYHEQQTFPDIGTTLNCSTEAARKLWARAVDQLQKKLSCPYEPR
ncbi:MAG TPA: sigma-70 family RNA polymerase sigma factor [Gemmataceae bacterium]|nr:sigma-70 family RNA polymerase sigma factor [Gemmataceae bacterium]